MSRAAEPVITLTVTDVRSQALIQDLGRPGYRHLGVPPSGAADRGSLIGGNQLLGNPPGHAGIEVLMGGLALRADGSTEVAVTGAPAPVTVDSEPVPIGTPVRITAGQLLEIGPVVDGLRCYVTVRGGVAESVSVPRVLGSLSSDPTSALGPSPLRRGTTLTCGAAPAVGARAPYRTPFTIPAGHLVLHASPGPRADWITNTARRALSETTWTVAPQADRVGVRLDGPRLALSRTDQLPSEGLVRGCVQVPPSGGPIVFLADHPTTGGYPVVAVVDPQSTDLLAQAPPGTSLRLVVRPG